jgi:hypothetical protein
MQGRPPRLPREVPSAKGPDSGSGGGAAPVVEGATAPV